MTVIAFPRHQDASAWSVGEIDVVLAAFDVSRTGRTWEVAATENGDPQLYLLGPYPEQACELCVSRIGGRYVLENGAGRLLAVHRNLDVIAMHVKDALRGRRSWLVARVILLWCTVRHIVHERVEPLLVETEDMLVHFAPQLATFA